MRNLEGKLQESCISWFDYAHPRLKQLLFAIPNGGARNVITGAILKRQGVRKGIPDLFLSIPIKVSDVSTQKNIHGLYIEMKFGKGKLTQEQKDFGEQVMKFGYKFEVCYSFDQFKMLIENYLCGTNPR